MPKVYIPNNSGHDFSDARKYGDLIFITSGLLDRFAVNTMYRTVDETLRESSPDDYIMVTGLTQINVILSSVFAYKHACLNLLIFDVKEGQYIVRRIVLDNQEQEQKQKEDETHTNKEVS
jgi:hypothetical protein